MENPAKESPAGLVGGRYRVLGAVGQGGMGRVWRAHDPVLDREVALKEIVLPTGLAEAERTRMRDRVVREARMAAQLNHAGIVRVHDIIEHEGTPVIVMEYLDGPSLGSVIRNNGPLTPREAGRLATAVIDALAHAHAAGIVHRDLKPDNIVLASGGRTVITDFGIARLIEGGTPLTVPGTILGTPAFMAPEQLEGKEVTAAADLWALGATLYMALEGHPPFEGATLTEIGMAILTRPAPPARNAHELAELLDRLLIKDPARRGTAAWAADYLARQRLLSAQPTANSARAPHDAGLTPTTVAEAGTGRAIARLMSSREITQRSMGTRLWLLGQRLGLVAAGVMGAISAFFATWINIFPNGNLCSSQCNQYVPDDGIWAWLPPVAMMLLAAAALFVALLPPARRPHLGYSALATGLSCAIGLTVRRVHDLDLLNRWNDGANSLGVGYYVAMAGAVLLIACGLLEFVARSWEKERRGRTTANE